MVGISIAATTGWVTYERTGKVNAYGETSKLSLNVNKF